MSIQKATMHAGCRSQQWQDNSLPSDAAQLMVDLQRRLRSQEATIALHEARIARLESTQGATNSPSPVPGPAIQTTDPQTPYDQYGDADLDVPAQGEQTSPAEGFRMDNMDLGPPTATLQSLRGIEGAAPTRTLLSDHAHSHRHARYDPVVRKILTYREASDVVRRYTEHYHPMAPFLSTEISAEKLIGQRSRLLLSICTIAFRVRPSRTMTACSDHQRQWQMHKLTELYENMLADAVLWPESADIDLDAVCVLLLHVQWMPLERLDHAPGDRRTKRSNYSDLSAWSVLGTAARFSTLLGLEEDLSHSEVDSEMDLSRFRVWRNLVSCDCNLMLSSGLPMTVDPIPIADVGSTFLDHPESQEPGDTRITALVELVAIINRSLQKAGLRSPRHLSDRQLSHLNLEMETWSNIWANRLQNTQNQHHCIPFTSWRWTSGATEIPPGPFPIDKRATEHLKYAVDLTWISLTFATVFLILCYVRGVIDEALNLCCLTPPSLPINRAPSWPCNTSRLSCLVKLSLSVFEDVCENTSLHPAQNLMETIKKASNLILVTSNPERTEGQIPNELTEQDLAGFLDEADWLGIFNGSGAENNFGWPQPDSFFG
ncbi:hypothetical protein NU195Hw_g3273t1 [Hortaea werneckii]